MSDPLDDADHAQTIFVERYKADRALELEISKFSGSLERSFLQAAAVLNGGSATVFLSFVGTTLGRVRVSTPLLATTFLLWLVGLVASLVAGAIAYRSQDFFGRALRNRRDAAGVEVLGESYTRSMGSFQATTPRSWPNVPPTAKRRRTSCGDWQHGSAF